LLSHGTAAARNGERWCFINVPERIVTDLLFDEIECIRDDYTFVIEREQSGVVNMKGKYVIKPEYDFIEYFSGYFLVNKGRLFGVCSKTGELLLPVEYTEQQCCDFVRARR